MRRLARKLGYTGPRNGRHLPTALGEFILQRWKDDDSEESYEKVERLLSAIRAHPEVAEREIDQYLEALDTEFDGLSMDERKTLYFVSHGYQTKEIARFEEVTESAVKERLRSARRKLGVYTTTEAVAICIRKGWLW